MKTNTVSTGGVNVAVIALGILAALLIFAVLTGRKVPLLSTDRAALVALVVIGMAICMPGIGRVASRGEWAHPLAIISYVLGGIIILIGLAAVFGKQIPPLTSYHQSFTAVVVIAAAKVVLATIHRLL